MSKLIKASEPISRIIKTNPTTDNNRLKLEMKATHSDAQGLADVAQSAVVSNAATHRLYVKNLVGDISLTASCEVMRERVAKVQTGDLSELEETLIAQTVTLNAIFNTMASRAALNMGEHLHATETYLRMALKAQAQSRATMETLAEIKYPKSATFVKQQNNAYQQQVNNGGAPEPRNSTRTGAPAHGNSDNQSNELLIEAAHEKVDSRRTGATVRANQDLETVEAINRSKDSRRKSG